jgi:hypothetical protein
VECQAGVIAKFALLAPRLDTVGNFGRSMVHTDATYLLAQAVGFDAESAYWIAAYDEATDVGQFTPRDQNGALVVDPATCNQSPAPLGCALLTASLDGVARDNYGSGGTLFHFHAPSSGNEQNPPGTDGLHPDAGDPQTELELAHVRRWAFDGAQPLCVAGLTERTLQGDYALGHACYTLPVSGDAGTVAALLRVLGPTVVAFRNPTGLQIISTEGGAETTSDNFNQLVGVGQAPDARLGIYLHVLQDRISHHLCTDDSFLTGPSTNGVATFVSNMSSRECAQGLHLLRHAWEVGVSQAGLPAVDQTLAAALAYTFDELRAAADARGVVVPGAYDERYRTDLLQAVQAALEVPDANARVAEMLRTTCQLRFQPLPGQGPCP